MEVKKHYKNLAERQIVVAEWESKKYRMLHDDFDFDWKSGEEPHGTMTFTDVMPPSPPVTPRDLATEIDALKIRVEKLEKPV